MFCRKCGQEIDDEAVVCIHCGCATKDEQKKIDDPTYNQPKTGMGVVMALFLGLIGLLFGVFMYPEGTVARKTFMKAWITTFLVSIAVIVVFYIIIFALVLGSL